MGVRVNVPFLFVCLAVCLAVCAWAILIAQMGHKAFRALGWVS